MSTPSDTPRTDAEAESLANAYFGWLNSHNWGGPSPAIVRADFARTLERELAEANEKAERYWLASLKLDAGLTEANETIRTRTAQLDRICSEAFDNDDTISCEHTDDYVIRQVAKLKAELVRWKNVAAQYAQEREHNANVAAELRAELAEARRIIGGEEREKFNTALMDFAPKEAGFNFLLSATRMIARAKKAEAENAALREDKARLLKALTRLRDCDWVISLPDRMDAVREIARAAIDAARGALVENTGADLQQQQPTKPLPELLKIADEIIELVSEDGPVLELWLRNEGRYVNAREHIAAMIDAARSKQV